MGFQEYLRSRPIERGIAPTSSRSRKCAGKYASSLQLCPFNDSVSEELKATYTNASSDSSAALSIALRPRNPGLEYRLSARRLNPSMDKRYAVRHV